MVVFDFRECVKSNEACPAQDTFWNRLLVSLPHVDLVCFFSNQRKNSGPVWAIISFTNYRPIMVLPLLSLLCFSGLLSAFCFIQWTEAFARNLWVSVSGGCLLLVQRSFRCRSRLLFRLKINLCSSINMFQMSAIFILLLDFSFISIPRIQLMAEWWKLLSLLRLCFENLHDSNPQRSACKGLRCIGTLWCSNWCRCFRTNFMAPKTPHSSFLILALISVYFFRLDVRCFYFVFCFTGRRFVWF